MGKGLERRVLVVDDDQALGMVLTGLLRQAGLVAHHVTSAKEALRRLETEHFDVLLTDLRMPEMDGMALLQELQRSTPGLPVIMLTAHATVELAVEAMKSGAVDFLAKPFDRDAVVFTVDKALARGNAGDEDAPPMAPTQGLLGDSAVMRECSLLVERAARSTAAVLLRGESGTGKEVAAREIHRRSGRRGAFVAVHCAALPDQLLESELFGYEKGAFTGASARKPGRVELAEGGTLLLDEIGDVSTTVQVKLLRLLQEREFQPLGATSVHRADVRFLAATHRDLEAMVEAGEFREDLYYRLNVIPIELPPLRHRRDDVAALSEHFLRVLCASNGRARLSFTEAAREALAGHDWPGNVRELANVIERLVVFADADVVDEEDVTRELARGRGRRAGAPSSRVPKTTLSEQVIDAERTAVAEALARAAGNRSQAARMLGISRRTLYNRLSELGLT